MLFQRKELRLEPEEEPANDQVPATAVSGSVRHALGRKGLLLQDIIGELRHDEHVHVPSMGNWSMHDMLAHILTKTGPADVWMTSWTISEHPIRLLVDLLNTGAIRSLSAVLSERVEAMNPKAHQVARFNIRVKLTKIHAKCIVVLNDEWAVSVGGSANFTRNPRIEKYIVCTHRSAAEADRDWIEQVLNNADPFADNG